MISTEGIGFLFLVIYPDEYLIVWRPDAFVYVFDVGWPFLWVWGTQQGDGHDEALVSGECFDTRCRGGRGSGRRR